MTNPFVKSSDPILRKVAKEIPQKEINSKETKRFVEMMIKKSMGNRTNKKNPFLVGLAAPQIGILKRIITVDVKASGKKKLKGRLKVFINPKIVWVSKEKTEWYEGCFSTGQICGIVKRPISIKIKALKLQTGFVHSNPNPVWKFEPIKEKYTGYIARIFQHEIDHLNGKFFIDLIKNPDHLHKVKKSEFPLYRNRQAWRNWPKIYPLPLALSKLKEV